MFASDSNSPVEEHELRQMLLELGVEFDEARLPRMLATVQPIRGRLRSAGPDQRRALLRRAVITAAEMPPGQVRVAMRLPVESQQAVPTLRHLVARLGTAGIAMITGTFALMSAGHWPMMMTFACLTGLLLYVAITGWGLGGQSAPQADTTTPSRPSPEPEARPGRRLAGAIVGIVLLYVTGLGHFLLFSVWTVLDPRFYAEGDVVSRSIQVMGLIVLFIGGSHVIRARRR